MARRTPCVDLVQHVNRPYVDHNPKATAGDTHLLGLVGLHLDLFTVWCTHQKRVPRFWHVASGDDGVTLDLE